MCHGLEELATEVHEKSHVVMRDMTERVSIRKDADTQRE